MSSISVKQSSLTKEQKQTVGLLSIGTFLEYFDLMLYVHMAVLLNDLFFPPTDPTDLFSKHLLFSLSFCATYLFRPLGAIIFGYIGDIIGRKFTVIITTIMMSFLCIVMANLPTYAQIGIMASVIVTICRILQGMSSLGEIIGAQLYVIESIKSPKSYPLVCSLTVFSALGGTFALLISSITTSFGFNWRIVFWMGALIVVVSFFLRSKLREAPEFVEAKRRIEKVGVEKQEKKTLDCKIYKKDKLDIKSMIAYFFMESTSPVYFYLNFIFCGSLLRSFSFSAEYVIRHNLLLSIINLLNAILLTLLVIRFHPFKLLRFKFFIFTPFILLYPYLLGQVTSNISLFIIQVIFILTSCSAFPANPIILSSFPVLSRFRSASFSFAAAKAFSYVTTAFGALYLIKNFGYYGLLFIIIPINIAYFFSMNHFKKLEQKL